MDRLTAADLFSPSKAREQRAQAQDWAQIESWLSYKYAGRTIPPFERNEDTLRVLRELSLANERADEERAIYERLEREALKELDESPTDEYNQALLSALQESLTPTGSAALTALASTALALNTPAPHPETIAHTLIQHTSTSQTLANHLAHIQTLQNYLEAQHAHLRAQLSALQSNTAFATPPALPRQTTDQVRQTKHLRAKIRECEDKLATLNFNMANPRRGSSMSLSGGGRSKGAEVGSAEAIAEMLEQQGQLDELRDRVEAVEEAVHEFAGLPADRELARREVGRLEVELDGVRRRRDGLFEGLVTR